MSMLELTNAYTAFAQEKSKDWGAIHEPAAIRRIREPNSDRLRDWPQSAGRQAIFPAHAMWLDQTLRQVVQRGTGKAALGVAEARGKTGTTNNSLDAWFVGSGRPPARLNISGLTVGVWVGHADGKRSLGRNEGGGITAAPIWKNFFVRAQP